MAAPAPLVAPIGDSMTEAAMRRRLAALMRKAAIKEADPAAAALLSLLVSTLRSKRD
jgi:hypothetical protein